MCDLSFCSQSFRVLYGHSLRGNIFPLVIYRLFVAPFFFLSFWFLGKLSFGGGMEMVVLLVVFPILSYVLCDYCWLIRIIYIFCYLIMGLSSWTMDFIQVMDILPAKETDLPLLLLVHLWTACSLINFNISLWNTTIFWYDLQKDTWIYKFWI